MKLVFWFSGFFLLSISSSVHSFSYDSAVYAAQKGNWEDAHAALNNIITNKPDNADVVYDAGVAAYNLGNASQARACFTRATELAYHDDKNLCFRAHFNAGNACVDDKDLKCALEHYDKALVIEPNNEHARHNRDRVAQMLEQEKQQEQQKKDDQKKEDKKDQQDKQDQQKQNQEGNDQQDQSGDQKNQQDNDQSGSQKDKQDGEQSSSAKNSADKSDQKSQGEQGDRAEQGDKDTQRKDHGNKEQQQKKSADNKDRNGDHELDKKANGTQSERDKQQSNQHNKAPEKQNTTKDDKTNVPGEGTQAQAKDEDGYGEIAINDPWLLNVLNNQELQDKAINKQLMEAKIRQHGGEKNAKNCW